MINAALAYARGGWHVFPVEPGGKRPLGMLVPRGKLDATTDEQIIRSWWSRVPDANIGISTAASGLVVLDVDPRHSGDASLKAIESQLAPTLYAQTGGGGLHVYYRAPAGEPILRIGVMPGLDIIGNGYVLAPPSLHASGQRYEWQQQAPIAPLPQVLIDLRRERATAPTELGARIPDGQRNTTLTSVAGSLRRAGMSEPEILHALMKINADRCVPPLAESEVATIAASVGRYDAVDLGHRAQMREGADQMVAELRPSVSVPISAGIAEIRAHADTPSILTPWPAFNDRTGGLELGSAAVGVGFQGSGKTSYAVQLGAHHAERGWTLYYLGEMTLRIIAARLIGQRRRLPWRNVLHGEVSNEDMHKVLDPLRMRIIRRNPDPIAAMRQTLAEVRAIDPTKAVLLIVDYVQLLASAGKDVRTATMQAVRDLMALIEDEQLAGFVLSQTSRGNSKRIREGTEDSIDLADTGAETAEIERAATLELVISYQQKDDTRVHEVTMAIPKRRFGGPTKVYFDYDGETGLWLERATAIKPLAHTHLEDAILEQLDAHAEGTCGGEQRRPCLAPMSLNTLASGWGLAKVHRVGGKKTLLIAGLKRLEGERRITKVGTTYARVKP